MGLKYGSLLPREGQDEDRNEQITMSASEIEDALELTGFTKGHLCSLAAISTAVLALFAQLELTNLLGPELYCVLDLSAVEEAFLTASLFLGMIFGSLFWGSISDRYGRKKTIQICSTLATCSVLLSSWGQTFIDILLVRIIIGLSLGGFHVCYTYATEIVGATYRARACLILFVAHFVGANYGATTAWVAIPNENLGWRFYILLSAIPLFISFLLISLVCPESPRFLLISGKDTEAVDVIKSLNSKTNKSLILFPLAIEERGSWKILTGSNQQVIMLVTISGAFFIIRFFNLGIPLLLYELLQNPHASDCEIFVETYKPEKTCDRLEPDDYLLDIIFSTSNLIGASLYIVMSDIIGRLPTMVSTLSISTSVVTTFFFCMPSKAITFCALVAKSFALAAELVMGLYVNEVFPTTSRSLASGVADCVSRVGLTVSPLVAQFLSKENYHLSVGIFLVSGLLGIGLLLTLRTETKGKAQSDASFRTTSN